MKDKLQVWLKEGESERLEFKPTFNQDTIETLVAFANAKGGCVLLGVSDDKEINWIEKYGSGIKRINNLFRDYSSPLPVFENFQHGFMVTAIL